MTSISGLSTLYESRQPEVCRTDLSWPEALTCSSTAFFRACSRCCGNGRDVTINFFCLDCADPAGFCSKCTKDHAGHECLQVRRSSYHDVVRVHDLQQVIDVSGIQTYMINSSKVIFIKQRPQPRHSNTAINCECCHRQLADASFCSLRCKLECHGLAVSEGGPSLLAVCPKGKRTQKSHRLKSPTSVLLAPGTPSNSEPDNCMSDGSTDCYQSFGRTSLTYKNRYVALSSNSRRKKKPCRSSFE